MATMVSTTTRTAMLEELFQRLEEESEQRALAEEQRELHDVEEEVESIADSAAWSEPSLVVAESSSATVRTAKERRRGSISISRFGVATTSEHTPSESRLPSTRPSRSSSIVLAKPTFYQLDSRLNAQTSSVDSFASSTSGVDPATLEEDVTHATSQQTFVPRSISRAISRRLSRAKEVAPLGSPNSLVIGVAVEATVEHHPDDDWHSAHGVSSAKVYTAGALRTQRSTPGLYEKASGGSGWVSKAKDITAKLRRRSLAALNGSPVAATSSAQR